MSNNEILVDVDEVLGDFQTPVMDLIQKVTGRSMTRENVGQWDIFEVLSDDERAAVFDLIRRPGFAYEMKPAKGAQEFVREAEKLGKVYVVTSPFHSPTWVDDRYRWLKEHFGLTNKHVVHTHAKYLVNGRVLLDDKPDHINNWLERRPEELALLWHIPNTEGVSVKGIRVNSWDAALSLIEKHLHG